MTERYIAPGAHGPSIADAPLRLTTIHETLGFLPHSNDEMFAAEDILGMQHDGGVMHQLRATHEHSRRRGDEEPARAVAAAVQRYISHYHSAGTVVATSRQYAGDLETVRPTLIVADDRGIAGRAGSRIAVHHRDLERRRAGVMNPDENEGIDPLTHDYLRARPHPLVREYMQRQLAAMVVRDARTVSVRAADANEHRRSFWGTQLQEIANQSTSHNGRLAERALSIP